MKSRFLSSAYEKLEPYVPGEQPLDRLYIKLNTNESPFLPSPKVLEAIKEDTAYNLYPDPAAAALCGAIAAFYQVAPENVTAGNGSDELLAFSFMAFCENGVCFADITYGFYPVYAEIFHIDAQIVPLADDFTIRAGDYFNAGRTVVIANPNAPTGIALTRADIEGIVRNNPGNLVIVDEAYVDFGAETCVPLTGRYDNILVVGTFSKSRNLAGARIGFAIGSPALIADLNRIRFSFNPYNVSKLSIAAGAAAIEDVKYFNACTEEIKRVRAWTSQKLQSLGFEVLPSRANFLFAKRRDISGETLYKKLKARGVLIRHFQKPRIAPFVRISIGREEEMRILIENIAAIIEEERT